jgi:hypothetical protein
MRESGPCHPDEWVILAKSRAATRYQRRLRLTTGHLTPQPLPAPSLWRKLTCCYQALLVGHMGPHPRLPASAQRRRWRIARTVVPSAVGLVIRRSPPTDDTRSAISVRPCPEEFAPATAIGYLDDEEVGCFLPPVIFRRWLTIRAIRVCDGQADHRVGSRVLDCVAYRGGDDEVCDSLNLRIGVQVCHVELDRGVNL